MLRMRGGNDGRDAYNAQIMKASFVPKLGQWRLALACAALLCALPAHALQSDRNQPLLVDAGAMHYDDVKQLDVFTGNVVVTKGSLVIHAQRVEIRQTPAGYAMAVAFGDAAHPATIDEALDAAPGEPTATLHGHALTLRYDGRDDVFTLQGQALLERLLDGRVSDRAQGQTIRYDNLHDRFLVTAGQGGSTASNPDGRVRVMLTPRGALPPASAPGTDLRPSRSLRRGGAQRGAQP